ncbi:hypothetical protein [Bacillus manliponensis]|uniref:hypothetical protein n=1 Tax=Bacillus manliponensis TaxID=574376 RepID=UPI0035151546
MIKTGNQNSIIQTNHNAYVKPLISSQTLVASVTSSSAPMKGQKNRSSGNFSIENLPPNTYALKWVIYGGKWN